MIVKTRHVNQIAPTDAARHALDYANLRLVLIHAILAVLENALMDAQIHLVLLNVLMVVTIPVTLLQKIIKTNGDKNIYLFYGGK